MPELISGGVYESKYHGTVILIFNDIIKGVAKYVMLSICGHSISGMSCPMFQHDKKNKFQFSEKELKEKYHFDDWVLLDGRLDIIKTNYKDRNGKYFEFDILKPAKIRTKDNDDLIEEIVTIDESQDDMISVYSNTKNNKEWILSDET